MSAHIVGNAQHFLNGDKKEITIGDKELLLVKNEDQFFAIDAKCSHYGAPLIKGAVSGSHVICPWHHACFDLKDGCLEEPPGTDNLNAYRVEIKGNDVVLFIEDQIPTKIYAATTKEHYVLIGGGNASFYAAKALRENDFTGKITILSAENHFPYDRIKCSKAFPEDGVKPESIELKNEAFFKQFSIEVKKNQKVASLNVDAKRVTTTAGLDYFYDKVLIATGGKVRKLNVPGAQLKNVYTLRSIENTNTIISACKGIQKVVVIGSSFIGLESASALRKKGLEVHVVGLEEIPFASKWGERVGLMMKKLHEDNGVIFHSSRKLTSIEGNGRAKKVILDNGETIETELVLVGIGVTPSTDFIEDLTIEQDDSVSTDEYLSISENIYAAGDVAQFPYKNKLTRIEHWRLAAQLGTVAGSNMAGAKIAFDKVPFFWTMQHGKNIRYVGFTKDYDEILYHGNVEEMTFLAFYIKGREIEAVLGMNRDTDLAAIELLMQHKRMPEATLIGNQEISWTDLALPFNQ